MNKCEYCKGNTRQDERGNCAACGAPKSIGGSFSSEDWNKMVKNDFSELYKTDDTRSSIPNCAST